MILDERKKITLLGIKKGKELSAMKGFSVYSPDGSIDKEDSIELDVTKSLSFSRSASVTSHAVEQGADITDHAKQEPKTISISAVIYDSEIFGLGSVAWTDKSVIEKLAILNQWMDESKPLFFLGYSSDKVEIPMVLITSMTESKPQKTGGFSRELQITLTKINITTSETTSINNPNKVKRDDGKVTPKKKEVKESPKTKKVESTGYGAKE